MSELGDQTSVNITVPLEEALNTEMQVRKYHLLRAEWQDFIEDANNAVASAVAQSDPTPVSSSGGGGSVKNRNLFVKGGNE